MAPGDRSVAVHLDLDGTLVESEGAYPLSAAAETLGVSVDDDQVATFRSFVVACFGRTAEEPYRRAAERWRSHYALDLDPDALAGEFERRQVERTRLVDGAPEVLSSLGAEFRLGLLSNGSGPVQRGKLDRHGLADAFASVVVSGETPFMKPDDGLFEVATDALPADQHVYVADRIAFDVVPARENGFLGVWVGDRDTPLADLTVDSVADLSPDAIQDLVARERG